MNYFGSIFVMVVCIAMSAYFSATETAFSSLNKTRLKVLADNGNKRATLALKLSEDYDKLISTILIGNNIVNIMVASIGTLLFVGLYGDIGATVSTVVVTIVVLIFGEITPKSVAKDTPERFALFSAPFIRLWILILTPLNFLFSQWKKLVSRFFKTDDDEKMSHEELLLFMEDVEQDGGIDENEGELLRNALEFRDLTAAEILTHRIDLEAVDIDKSHSLFSIITLPLLIFKLAFGFQEIVCGFRMEHTKELCNNHDQAQNSTDNGDQIQISSWKTCNRKFRICLFHQEKSITDHAKRYY